MGFIKRTFVTLLLATVATTGANAAQITQVKTFSGIPDLYPVLTFDKFNPGAGNTLNWIKVTLNLDVNGGQYVLDNDADTPASGSFSFGGKCFISGSSIPMLNSGLGSVVGSVQASHSQTFSLAPNEGDGLGDYSPLGPDGMVYVGGQVSDSKSGYISNTLFGSYTGSGKYTVNLDCTQISNYSGASGIEAGITPVNASGNMTIVYGYSPVPEPSSIIGLIGGLGALGLFRRRR